MMCIRLIQVLAIRLSFYRRCLPQHISLYASHGIVVQTGFDASSFSFKTVDGEHVRAKHHSQVRVSWSCHIKSILHIFDDGCGSDHSPFSTAFD